MNLIGFFKCDLTVENYDYWEDVILNEFEKIDLDKKNYNTWLISFHYITRILNLNPVNVIFFLF